MHLVATASLVVLLVQSKWSQSVFEFVDKILTRSFDLCRRLAKHLKVISDEQVLLLCNRHSRRDNKNASDVLPFICLTSYVLAVEADHNNMSDLFLCRDAVHSHVYI